MYRISVLLGWYLFLAFYGICKSVAEQTPVTFTFKEYQYKDTPKNVSIRYCGYLVLLQNILFKSVRLLKLHSRILSSVHNLNNNEFRAFDRCLAFQNYYFNNLYVWLSCNAMMLYYKFILQEMTFREFETACEQSGACSHMAGLARTRCVRECVSPSCYRELYQTDPVNSLIILR